MSPNTPDPQTAEPTNAPPPEPNGRAAPVPPGPSEPDAEADPPPAAPFALMPLPPEGEIAVPPAPEPTTPEPPPGPAPEPIPEVPPPPASCPGCGTVRAVGVVYCGDCGFIFPPEVAFAAGTDEVAASVPPRGTLVKGRYRIGDLMSDRCGVLRFRGEDLGGGEANPVPVVVVRQAFLAHLELPEAVAESATPVENPGQEGDLLPDFDAPLTPVEPVVLEALRNPAWPSLGWERRVLEKAAHLALPRVLDFFREGGFEYAIEESAGGQSFWDAWDDPAANDRERFGWLIQLAEALQRLHEAGAIFEGLRPEMVLVTPGRQAFVADVTDLLPLPLPENVSLRGTHYTAPELVLDPGRADARADLYGFGATLYALFLGRELTDLDFALPGVPKPFLERFPEVHPLVGRLVAKTFCRERDRRFPTEEAILADPTGMNELIRTLEACQRNVGRVRLDVAAWTTTGVVRSGNEDAVAVLHSAEARLEDADEFVVALLADGMGGMESGEVAAALAVQAVRQYLLAQPPLSGLMAPGTGGLRSPVPRPPAGPDAFDVFRTEPTEGEAADAPPLTEVASPSTILTRPSGRELPTRSADAYKERLVQALKEANRQVYHAARNGLANRGMGCTAEAVFIDGAQVAIAHVGDSRTYHLHRGKLTQVTRDQTLVTRLVELGHLSEEEAEHHPRRSELQQAIGGRAEVFPDTYDLTLAPGDWLLVCSDGLTNQLRPDAIREAILQSGSAEKAARRLVNLANLHGAADNVTVVVVRAV